LKNSASRAANGFAIHIDVLSRAELAGFVAELIGNPPLRSRAGARHLMSVEAVARMARDPRLISLATRELDAPAVPFKATLFDKSMDSNWLVAWHQDTALPVDSRIDAPGWGPWSDKQGVTYAHAPAAVLEGIVALRVHLDDSTDANGPLKVLPGTHRLGVLGDAQVAEIARSSTPVSCTAPAGSAVAMRPLLVHASSKAEGDQPRRVLHVEYAASMELDAGLRLRIA
jgi:hypothetical protein